MFCSFAFGYPGEENIYLTQLLKNWSNLALFVIQDIFELISENSANVHRPMIFVSVAWSPRLFLIYFFWLLQCLFLIYLLSNTSQVSHADVSSAADQDRTRKRWFCGLKIWIQESWSKTRSLLQWGILIRQRKFQPKETLEDITEFFPFDVLCSTLFETKAIVHYNLWPFSSCWCANLSSPWTSVPQTIVTSIHYLDITMCTTVSELLAYGWL